MQIMNIADALDITATGIEEPIRLNTTPFAGGQGREAIVFLGAAVGGAGVVKLQGHDSPLADPPAEADTGWYDVVTLNAASPLRQEILDLPAWIRVNVDTVGTGTVTINLEGTP